MGYWIVIVDDNAVDLKYARTLLDGQEMRISCLRCGEDLLTFMETNKPDLVLMDIMMPGMDGFETLQSLRKFEEINNLKNTPVILLSGNGDSATERKGLKIGASDFIRKPLDKEILISRIVNTIENNKTIEALTEKAMEDKLTGFFNKTSGTEKITEMCKKSNGALMLLDLDNFKLVNDIYGHETGDKVLISFADIMRNNTRSEDVISRIGGDEFLAFFGNLKSEDAVKALTNRLNDQLYKQCVEIMGDGFDIPIGISIGVAFVPEHSRDYPTLFRFVDSSMYMVKQNGKHGVHIHKEDVFVKEAAPTNDLEEDMDRFNRILEERYSSDGAMIMGKDTFIQVYHFAVRFLRKYKKGVEKILFSISFEDSWTEKSMVYSMFIEMLQKNLRKSDVIVHVKPDQFFLFLPVITQEEGDKVVARIEEAFAALDQKSVTLRHVEKYISFE